MTEPVHTTDSKSQGVFDSNADGVAGAATRAGKPGPSTGLDDLDDVLGKHADKTKNELDESEKTLKKSAKGIKDIGATDKNSAGLFPKGAPPAAMRPSPGPMPAPQAAMPAPAPAPAATPTASSAPIPSAMRPIAPQALANLLSNAGVTPTAATQAGERSGRNIGTGAKDPLAEAKYERSGRGKMSPAELRAAIDEAADAVGIPTDKTVRAKWHALYMFMIEHESGGQPDIIQGVKDVNQSGPIIGDGGRANAARGLCQVVPGTFMANHVAGTSNNIFDPVANIAASMRYVMDHHIYEVEPDAGPNFERFASRRRANGYTGY